MEQTLQIIDDFTENEQILQTQAARQGPRDQRAGKPAPRASGTPNFSSKPVTAVKAIGREMTAATVI